LFFGITFSTNAQDFKFITTDNDLKLCTLPCYNYVRGLGLTSHDSIFQLNIPLRMQNRVSNLEIDGQEEIIDGQIR
jgi:hypothetical protein